MTENRKTPKLRFKCFTDAWEQRKLGEFTISYSGGTPSVGIKEYYNGQIPFIRSAEINSEITELFLTEEGLKNSSARLVDVGDILYALYGATSGEVGRARLKGAVNQAILVIKPHKEYDSEFLTNWLRKSKESIVETYLQGGQGNLSGTIVKELLVCSPSHTEQEEIGSFFYNLDNLITLHQRKLDRLKNIKKSMLDKMFPKDGEVFPEIRFKGFTDAWEQRKLGEVGSVSMCRRIFKEQTSESGDIPFYKIGTFGGQADTFISEELFAEYRSKYPYPKEGDILISASGSIGRTVEFTGGNEYFQDSNIVWLSHDDRLDNTFLKYFYSVVKWAGIEGSTIKRLYNDNILHTVISMPSVAEQKKIGAFFKELDHLITLHQRKLDKLKNIKKSMLDNMFV